jgi:hypothetical protein
MGGGGAISRLPPSREGRGRVRDARLPVVGQVALGLDQDFEDRPAVVGCEMGLFGALVLLDIKILLSLYWDDRSRLRCSVPPRRPRRGSAVAGGWSAPLTSAGLRERGRSEMRRQCLGAGRGAAPRTGRATGGGKARLLQ